jgi:hypothetical protein
MGSCDRPDRGEAVGVSVKGFGYFVRRADWEAGHPLPSRTVSTSNEPWGRGCRSSASVFVR